MPTIFWEIIIRIIPIWLWPIDLSAYCNGGEND